MYNRDSKGRFSKKKVFWTIVICAVVWAVLVLIAADKEINIQNKESIIPVQVAQADSVDYAAKILEIKADMLKQLSLGCETKSVKEPDGAIILDTNNKMSIGRYMFQIDTIKYYIKKYEDRVITSREAIEIAVDPTRAEALAEKILFREPTGYDNWAICSAKLGIAKEIEILKKLTN
jgi:hypothetical protein